MDAAVGSRLTSSPHWPWLAASAVLTTFQPDRLRPLGGGEPDFSAAAEMMLQYAEPVKVGPAAGRWRLREDVRRRVIAALGSRDAIQSALRSNSDEQQSDPTQRALLELTTSASLPALAGRSLEDLLGIDRAVQWLGAAHVSPVPAREEITMYLERQKLLEPLTRLVRGFEGREEEQRELRSYVDTLPSQSIGERVLRFGERLRYVFSDRPPLVIHGPGGAGKSTLIAKFILDHAAAGDRPPMAFALLDFDRSTLDPTRPDGLLLELARQLRVQFPEYAPQLQALAEDVDIRLGAEDRYSAAASSHFVESDRVRAVVAAVMNEIASRTAQNILFVIDTFEIVQRRGPTAVYALLDLAAVLLQQVARLRVVIVGRAELRPEDFSFSNDVIPGKPLRLGGFDAEAGRAYLRARLEELKLPERKLVSDKDLDRLVEQVRGNPLGLRLAAQVFAREGVRGVEEAIGRQRLNEAIAEEQVQGLLHERIVEHLDDPDLQRIASPGLIVRRITSEVIERVLAGPCGLDLERRSAGSLLDALRREVSLVEMVDDQTVRHRPDVRLIMLPALRRDLGPLAHTLDDGAVEYWEHQPGAEARAEEIYHRLWRRDPSKDLDSRWMPEAATYLEDALDEFQTVTPDDWSRIWLAEKLDRELPEDLRKRADQIAFEHDVERKARRLISDGKLEEAVRVLYERPIETRTPASALWLLDIDVRLLRGELDQGSMIIDRAMQRLGDTVNSEHTTALLSRKVVILERMGRLDEARQTAREAIALARTAHDPVSMFTCGVTLIRLSRKTNHSDDPDVVALRSELADLIDDRAVQQALVDRPSLLREAAAELGPAKPALIADALERFGLEAEASGRNLVLPESIREVVKGLGKRPRVAGSGIGRRELGAQIAKHVRADRMTAKGLDEIANLYANTVEKLSKQVIS